MPVENKRLLFSLAHPDDESFGFAGTIIHCVRQGVDVQLICATNGEEGEAAPRFMEKFESVAALRLSELACARQALGMGPVHLLNYRDSGMAGSSQNNHANALASQDLDEVVERVVLVMRQFRPQVVITFDPYGGYGHPDHIAIHRATVKAFHAAGDATQYPHQLEMGYEAYQPQALYVSTWRGAFINILTPLAPLFGLDLERMGRNNDMNFKKALEESSGPLHVAVRTRPYREAMKKAWACHASQQSGEDGESGFNIASFIFGLAMGGGDHYTRIHPPVEGRMRTSDFFQGVTLAEEQ